MKELVKVVNNLYFTSQIVLYTHLKKGGGGLCDFILGVFYIRGIGFRGSGFLRSGFRGSGFRELGFGKVGFREVDPHHNIYCDSNASPQTNGCLTR